MYKRVICFFLLVYLCFSSIQPSVSQSSDLLKLEKDKKVLPLRNSVTWKPNQKDVRLDLHFTTAIKPSSLVIGRNHPNSTKFLAEFANSAISLPVEFPDEFDGFTEWGDLASGYSIQATEHDFDGDGNPEIVIAAGDNLTNLAVCVVKYHPPASTKDQDREENWSLVGKFSGQEKAIISKDAITLPFGSVGLFQEFTWVKRKFVETTPE